MTSLRLKVLVMLPVVVGLLAIPIAWASWKGSWRIKGDAAVPLSRVLQIFYGAIFTAFTIVYFFHAWAPESSHRTRHGGR